MKRIHIFRPGRHTTNSGTTLEFTEAQLAASAAAYDPAKHEAPLVVGHPKTDDPAYGWVRSLQFGETGLEAIPDQVEPQFDEMVQAGRFKKVSASFYPPGHPGHPIQAGDGSDAYYLRHVGFLGAQPPSIKGLKHTEFADNAEGIVEIEFSDAGDEALITRIVGKVLEVLRGKGSEFAEPEYAGPHKSYPIKSSTDVKDAWDLAGKAADPDAVRRRVIQIAKAHNWADALPATARDWAKAHSISFSDQEVTDVDPKELEQREAALAEREKKVEAKETAFSEREQQLTEQERERAAAASAEFVEGLVKDGKVLPREKGGVTALVTSLQGAQELEFSEDDKSVKEEPAKILREFLEGLPKRVDFNERSKDKGGKERTSTIKVPQGYEVSPEGAELHNRILAYAEEHNVDYETAVARVSAEN